MSWTCSGSYFERWVGHRLLPEKTVPVDRWAGRTIVPGCTPVSEGVQIIGGCTFIGNLFRSPAHLSGGLARFSLAVAGLALILVGFGI